MHPCNCVKPRGHDGQHEGEGFHRWPAPVSPPTAASVAVNPATDRPCVVCGHALSRHTTFSGWCMEACPCFEGNDQPAGGAVMNTLDPIDPPAGSPGLDARTPEQALREVERTERREAHKRLRLAREAAAWWLWLAIRREKVAAALDTDDGIRPELFALAHAAGMRAAAAEDEAGCSEADVRLHLSTVRASDAFDDEAARGLEKLRIERRAKGARLRALRAIVEDTRRWCDVTWNAALSRGVHPEQSRGYVGACRRHLHALDAVRNLL
jgi:hypothetical protein